MNDQPGTGGSGYASKPVPDPTVLTTQALYREVSALKELIEQRLESQSLIVQEQFRGLQRQLKLLLHEREIEFANLKEVIESRVEGVLDVENEKAQRIEQQFDLFERQRVEQKKDTKDAVDAALTAQKEAVREQTASFQLSTNKSEAAINKQLEQQAQTFKADNDSLRRSLDDLKEQNARTITDLERNLRASIVDVGATANASVSEKRGAKEDRSGLYATIGVIGTIVVIAATLIGFVLASSGAP
jgi:hypothetical protein